MQLYVVRHGIAAPAPTDADRALSEEGRELFALGVRGLGRLGVRLERVVSSPLLRAVETAELLAPLLTGERAQAEALAHAPSRETLECIAGDAAVALVGHEPWQSELIAWLTTDQRGLGGRFALKKGAVALLEGRPEPGGMTLAGMWRPEVLQALGEV
jgi:phosphohistidine phosphatase